MLLKQILKRVTNPQKSELNASMSIDCVPQHTEPQTLYERIAQGNALEEAETYARNQWSR